MVPLTNDAGDGNFLAFDANHLDLSVHGTNLFVAEANGAQWVDQTK
jgi:hypothetical protein